MMIQSNGGYPNGYPPNNPWQQQQAYASQYSPFINPTMQTQQQSQLENVYVTGNGQVHGAQEGPIQYQSVATQQQMAPQQYQQQMTPQQYQQQMTPQQFNPYSQNPQAQSYGQQQQGNNFSGYANQQSDYGANPYLTSGYGQNQGYGNYGYNQGYNNYGYNQGYNYNYQFDCMVNEETYGGPVPYFDPYVLLRDIVLTDDEKNAARSNTPAGYGYNGSPYYNNEQIASQQKIITEAKETVLNFWMSLSKAAHNCTDDGVTNDDIYQRYHPAPPIAPQYHAMSREEMEFSQRMSKVNETQSLHYQITVADQSNIIINQKIGEAAKKIKESHDKILGIAPEDMNIKNYLSNAGLLYVDAMMREQKNMMKDGKLKYTSETYKSLIHNNSPTKQCDTLFMNNDYIPLENRIKDQYIRNKTRLLQNPDGSLSPSTPPPQVDPETEKSRANFLAMAMEGMRP